MATARSQSPIAVIGAALDALPHPERVAVKRAYAAAAGSGRLADPGPATPYRALLGLLASGALGPRLVPVGEFQIPSYLGPTPEWPDLSRVNPAGYEAFLARDGCRTVAAGLRRYIETNVGAATPLLLGVDHALTAAAFAALAARKHPDPVALVVLDGHLDAITATARAELWTATQGPGQASGAPRATSTAEPLTCQSFLRALITEGHLDPRNLIVAGIYERPDERLLAAYGPGAKPYLAEFSALEEAGATILERDRLRQHPEDLRAALARLAATRLYVSLDMDVAASDEHPAVRFRDGEGLAAEELLDLAAILAGHIAQPGIELIGLDVMEIDVHLLASDLSPGSDNRTLATAIRFLERVAGA